MKNLFKVALVGLLIYWIWGALKPDKWIGFYYPDADNLSNYRQSWELESYSECLEWVDDVSNGRTDTGFDYECGKNCKPNKEWGGYICEETLN